MPWSRKRCTLASTLATLGSASSRASGATKYAAPLPCPVVVVGHEVDPVGAPREIREPCGALRRVEHVLRIGARGHGEEIALAVGGAGAVERGAELAPEPREVVLVLRTVAGLVRRRAWNADRGRIFPVDVDPVEAVALQECDRRGNELRARRFGARHVRKPVGPVPSAHGSHELQVRIRALHFRERLQVGRVEGGMSQRDRAVGPVAGGEGFDGAVAVLAVPADIEERIVHDRDARGVEIEHAGPRGVIADDLT